MARRLDQADVVAHLRDRIREQEELDAYLKQLEEAEKRDHRKLAREMDLFHTQEEGPGSIFWHPKGWTLFQTLVAYMRRRLAGDYQEVNAPQVLDKHLWEISGHWGWYRESMFMCRPAGDEAETEDLRVYALKPMNCPGHVQIFKHGLRSYRELPLRLAEFGAVNRYEPSGALHGLMRVRAFTQDDAHIFCTEEQLAEECHKINELILSVYRHFGFDRIVVKLSTRPEKRVGTDAMWDHAEAVMSGSWMKSDCAMATSSRPRSTRARALSTDQSSNMCCAMRLAAIGSVERRRSISTCRSVLARSILRATAKRRRR